MAGENATLSYTAQDANVNIRGSGGSSIKLRVRALGHAYGAVATESHARQYRAFYPHQLSLGHFFIQPELIHYPEYSSFMFWFRSYVFYALKRGASPVTVQVPARNFMRTGVPVSGGGGGDHIGSNVFSPIIVFQTISDPLDPNLAKDAATFEYDSNDVNEKFFYPFSPGSMDPNVKGETFYDRAPITPGAPAGDPLHGILDPPKPPPAIPPILPGVPGFRPAG